MWDVQALEVLSVVTTAKNYLRFSLQICDFWGYNGYNGTTVENALIGEQQIVGRKGNRAYVLYYTMGGAVCGLNVKALTIIVLWRGTNASGFYAAVPRLPRIKTIPTHTIKRQMLMNYLK